MKNVKLKISFSFFGFYGKINQLNHHRDNSSPYKKMLFASKHTLIVELEPHFSPHLNDHIQIRFAKFNFETLYPSPFILKICYLQMWSQCVEPFFELMPMRNVWRYQLIFSDPILYPYLLDGSINYTSPLFIHIFLFLIYTFISLRCKFLRRALQKNCNCGFSPNLASLKKQDNSIVSIFFFQLLSMKI